MEKISIELTKNPRQKPDMKTVGFGQAFSDHMFLMNYVEGQGWINPRIVPYGPLEFEPSAMVFHYAQEVFEGMKAYRRPDGGIQLFRPMENFRRLNNSSKRLEIPEIPESDALAALKALIEVDRDWVPSEPDTSLYIRPFIIATDPAVGVHASHTYLFAIITCPVGSYYKEGLNPVRIYVESRDVRAVAGGTGEAKTGGNYAASLRAGSEAEAAGYSQVLWLDGVERRYIEEVGSMNVMFKINGEIVTPPLLGSVLPGITRKSIIELAKSWGLPLVERRLSIDELVEAAESGALEEAFGCGTAAVVSPIGEIGYRDKAYTVSGGGIGEVTQRLYDELTAIQWGKSEDSFGWTDKVC